MRGPRTRRVQKTHLIQGFSHDGAHALGGAKTHLIRGFSHPWGPRTRWCKKYIRSDYSLDEELSTNGTDLLPRDEIRGHTNRENNSSLNL